ncbi:type IV pilus modification protein PilV [Nitrospira defluvii]|nr:type IV pilus modification protein PilV [Nitrospira defluvii]
MANKKGKQGRLQNKKEGFTLLEVLITVSILSVGLLGIASMQTVALNGTVFGSRMSTATNLADEMMERIRLRSPGVTINNFSINDYNGIDTSDTSTRPPSSAWQARGDYDQWLIRIQANIPNGAGTVTVTQPSPNPLNRNNIQVQITWPGASITHSVTMTTSIDS